MSSPSVIVCHEVFDENSQPSAEGFNNLIFVLYILLYIIYMYKTFVRSTYKYFRTNSFVKLV